MLRNGARCTNSGGPNITNLVELSLKNCLHGCIHSCMHVCMHVCMHACMHTWIRYQFWKQAYNIALYSTHRLECIHNACMNSCKNYGKQCMHTLYNEYIKECSMYAIRKFDISKILKNDVVSVVHVAGVPTWEHRYISGTTWTKKIFVHFLHS